MKAEQDLVIPLVAEPVSITIRNVAMAGRHVPSRSLEGDEIARAELAPKRDRINDEKSGGGQSKSTQAGV